MLKSAMNNATALQETPTPKKPPPQKPPKAAPPKTLKTTAPPPSPPAPWIETVKATSPGVSKRGSATGAPVAASPMAPARAPPPLEEDGTGDRWQQRNHRGERRRATRGSAHPADRSIARRHGGECRLERRRCRLRTRHCSLRRRRDSRRTRCDSRRTRGTTRRRVEQNAHLPRLSHTKSPREVSHIDDFAKHQLSLLFSAYFFTLASAELFF